VAFWITAIAAVVLLIAGVLLGAVLALVNRHKYPPVLIAAEVLVTTLSMGLTSLATTFTAEQTIEFQFRRLAWIGSAGAILTAVLTIVMAYSGAGSWTLVVPATAANALVLGMLWRSGQWRPGSIRKVRLKRSWGLLKVSLLLTGAGFFSAICMQADNYFVGQFQAPEMLTIYMVAYSMSFQFVQLISKGVRGTFLSAFSRMAGNPERPTAAYIEAIKVAALVCMPACILPIPAAHAAVILVFTQSYEATVPLFRIFLSGMGFVVISAIAMTLLYARGTYRKIFHLNLYTAVIFCSVVGVTAAFGRVQHVAGVVTVIYVATSLVFAVAAAEPCDWRTRGRILWGAVLPCLIAGGAAVCGWEASRLLGWDTEGLAGGAAALLSGAVVYGVGALGLMPRTMMSAIRRGQDAFSRRRRQAAGAGGV
jgi:O-antigen/teichoic acid export membrane protein